MRSLGYLLGVLLLAAAGRASASQSGPSTTSGQRLAVLEFSGKEGDFDTSYLGAATDRARAAVIDAATRRGLVVMTHENMLVILGQEGPVRCLEGECDIETARKLGAAYVITGRLLKIEKTYSATVKLHDARTAVLVGAMTLDVGDPVALMVGIAERARELVQSTIPLPGRRGVMPVAPLEWAPDPRETRLPPGEGEVVVVRFETRPAGALVRVDGRPVCQSTPCSARVPTGPHEAEMELVGYDARVTAFEARREGSLTVELSQAFGHLTVRTRPPGVRIAINGEETGTTPLENLQYMPGTVAVSAVDPCFHPSLAQGTITRGSETTVDLPVRQRETALRVAARDPDGTPVDGEVVVDGKARGWTGQDLTVPLCARQASLSVRGASWSAKLALQPDTVNQIDARLFRPYTAEVKRGKPAWVWWMGATGALLWGGAGAGAIVLHREANSYPAGDPRVDQTVALGRAAMIASNVGAAMVLTAVIGLLATP